MIFVASKAAWVSAFKRNKNFDRIIRVSSKCIINIGHITLLNIGLEIL